jgi:hypothetical protein
VSTITETYLRRLRLHFDQDGKNHKNETTAEVSQLTVAEVMR